MVSEKKAKDRRGGSAMELRSNIDATTTQKCSRSPPEHMEKQRDHDISVLPSRVEEDFACVSSTTSPGVWYIDSGASAHMTGVRECFSSYQEEQMNF